MYVWLYIFLGCACDGMFVCMYIYALHFNGNSLFYNFPKLLEDYFDIQFLLFMEYIII